MNRGRYFTIPQAVEACPVLTERLIRRLVEDRRIAYSKCGRRVILAEADIEDYLEANRREPAAGRTGAGYARNQSEPSPRRRPFPSPAGNGDRATPVTRPGRRSRG
jgi:hypothetical protein